MALGPVLVLVVVMLVGVIASVGRVVFDARVRALARTLVEDAGTAPIRSPTAAELATLPAPVRRYLAFSGVLERPPPRLTRLEHGGAFRTGPERAWAPIAGVEYLSARPPAFLWYATLRAIPFLPIRARDHLRHAHGRMTVKLLSLISLVDVRGPELDQGAVLRYLAETPWLPSALLPGGPVDWIPIDDASARAVWRDRGDVTAVFHFARTGAVERVEADRYMSVDGGFRMLPWEGTYGGYRVIDGLQVPFDVTVTWRLEAGEYPYARFHVKRIVFDPRPAQGVTNNPDVSSARSDRTHATSGQPSSHSR